MSAPGIEVIKVHNAVFLGTDTSYEKKADPANTGLVRAETLSFHYDMLPTDGSNSRSILDGPNTAGTNVYEKIAEGATQLLTAIGDGATVVNISAHSRGAVEAILVANFLYQLQLACEKPENGGKDILAIIAELQLTQEGHLADKKDFDQSQAELNKVKAVFATSPKLREQVQALRAKSSEIKTHIADHKINILAIDPVPGDFSAGVPWLWTMASMSWLDKQMFNIPPNVGHYQQYLYAHEDSRGFKPIKPSAQDSTKTEVDIDILPGHHGTGSGNLHHQDGTVVALADKTQGDTSAVQELLLCKLVDFSEEHSQYKFTDADVERASEKNHDTYPAFWQAPGVALTSLKDLVKKYISHTENRASFRKDLYKKMVANKAAYEILRAFSYYSSYIRGFGSEQSFKLSLPTPMLGTFDTWFRWWKNKSIMPVSSRIFYTERRDNNHIRFLDAYFRPCFTSDIVNKEHAELKIAEVMSSIGISQDAIRDGNITDFSNALLAFITKVTTPRDSDPSPSLLESVPPDATFAATPGAEETIKDFLTQILDRLIENNLTEEEDTHLKNMFAGLLEAVYSSATEDHGEDGSSAGANKESIKRVINQVIEETNTKIKGIDEQRARLLKDLTETTTDLELQRSLIVKAVALNTQKNKLIACLQKLATITSNSGVEAVNPAEISALSAIINAQVEKLKSIAAIDDTDIANIDEINKHEELIKELSDIEQQSRLQLEELTGVRSRLLDTPRSVKPDLISTITDIQGRLDELHAKLRALTPPADSIFDETGLVKNAIKQVENVCNRELHAQKVRTLTSQILCLTMELSMAKAAAAETARAAAVAQAATTARHAQFNATLQTQTAATAAAAETARAIAVAQASAAQAAAALVTRAQVYTKEKLDRVTLINARAVKMGCTFGLIVTVAVGATLLVYFLAPAIVPVLISKTIVGILGSCSVMTASLAVKSLALTAFAGVFFGLAAKEITSVVEDKRIPQIQAPVLA